MQRSIEDGREHDTAFVDLTILEAEGEGRLIGAHRAAEVQIIELRAEWRGPSHEGIPRVEDTVVELCESLAVEPFAAGLGEDLDARKAGAVVLSRERVGVDPHLANGGLRG